MKSLELLEELNKILINADKQAKIVYEDVGEYDKSKTDFEHSILNDYSKMSAKDKRIKIDDFYNLLVERHERKYEYRELEILKELYNLSGLENAINNALNKLRKLNKEIETPVYYKRAKKNKGEVIIVDKDK